MASHGFARGTGGAAADRIVYAPVLGLDHLEIGAPAAHALGQAAHRASRNEMAADELQEARKLGIARRLRDGAMKGEVLVDGVLVLLGGALDCFERKADRANLRAARALGGEPRRLDLDA